LPAQVLAEHPKVAILVNNAGVSLVGTFAEVTLEEFRWLIEINFLAVVGLTKGFLPTLLAQPQAQIVNISSIFGIIAPAEQTAYAASKFAVRGFSESLRHELAGTNVGVTVVHPGGIKTAIATSARIAAAADARLATAAMNEFTESALRTPPEAAAAAIVGAIQRRAKRLLIGADAQALAAVQRLFPVSYWSVLGRLYQRFVLDERPPEAGGRRR
ncbi:MAG TPA: SDR family NAD(P)-dependent oxidoreductase, partial [Herpetosiphonaceae bacterium]